MALAVYVVGAVAIALCVAGLGSRRWTPLLLGAVIGWLDVVLAIYVRSGAS